MRRMTQTFPPACCRMAQNAGQVPMRAAAPAAACPMGSALEGDGHPCARSSHPSAPARLGDMEKWQPLPRDAWLSEPSFFLSMLYPENF